MKNVRFLAASLAVALVSLLAVPSAEALRLRITASGGGFVDIVDDAFPDFAPGQGGIVFVGDVGDFDLTVTTGLSDPISGSTGSPLMKLDVTAFTPNAAGGTILVELTDTDFGPSTTGASAVLNILALPANAFVAHKTYYDGGNAEFAQTVELTSQLGNGVSSDVETGSLPSGAAPYSLTQVVGIVLTSSGAASVQTALSVPDGGLALSLLGFGLVGLEGLRRRFKK
jgi:hypothetical protein